MFRNTILFRTLGIVLASVLLSAVITLMAFAGYGGQAFSEMKAGEMEPRARFLARATGEYLMGHMGMESYKWDIGSGYHIWDAAMYAYTADGALFVYPARSDNEANTRAISEYLDRVLEGESISSANARSSRYGVIIGEPVLNPYTGEVIGAVFLVKPLAEMYAATSSLLAALVISMVASIAIMLLPAYLGARKITNPIRQMTAAAAAMAEGNFTARAAEDGAGDVAQLGRSLNHLSEALSSTISSLTLEKNRLHAVINGMGEGIIALAADGGITKANSAALRLLGGRDGEELTGLPAFNECAGDIGRLLAGEDVPPREIGLRGRRLRVSLTALAEEGRTEGAVMLIQDVTEAHRLEQTRVEYVANVSHELRTPIASIRGLADALNDGLVKKEEDRARYYGYILHESMRLSRLIDDLLELSRLQSGAVALSRQYISLDELLLDVAERFSHQAGERGLAVNTCIRPGCQRAYTNPDRAEQVLVILLDNAIRHGLADGEICLLAEPYRDRLKLSVSNPGSIPEEDVEHVFERFYKADKAHSGSGTGLGLSIAREVLKLMGEEIWVESRDGRVTFSFTLAIERTD